MASEQETGLDTIESLKSELEKRSLELKKTKIEFKNLHAVAKKLKEKLDNAEGELTKLKQATPAVTPSGAIDSSVVQSLESKVKDLEGQITTLQARCDSVTADKEAALSQKSESESLLQQSLEERSVLAAQHQSAEEALSTKEQECRTLESNYNQLREQSGKMKTLLGHFDKLVKEEKEKNKKLLEIVESQKAVAESLQKAETQVREQRNLVESAVPQEALAGNEGDGLSASLSVVSQGLLFLQNRLQREEAARKSLEADNKTKELSNRVKELESMNDELTKSMEVMKSEDKTMELSNRVKELESM
ncbi:hypothetical protein WA538_002131, partial [Blastocystis sp. DL]